jgi:hypothetical protein
MATVRQKWREAIAALRWEEWALRAFLEKNSNLPGPRSNLELAAALADEAASAGEPARDLLLRWAAIPDFEAPFGGRAEFVPGAALQALGVIAVLPEWRARCLAALRSATVDPRWRVRESAAIGLQRLGERELGVYCDEVRAWAASPSALVLRAALVALAHPPVLHDAAVVALGWEAAEAGLERLRRGPIESAEARRILTLALSFAPSVFTAASPVIGFRNLARWADVPELVVKKIVVSNLRKARLAKAHPEECEAVAARLLED